MALVVTPTNYQLIHECETITGITGPTTALVPDFYKQGSNCVGFTARAIGEHLMYATGSWNLTGKTIRLWYMTANLKEINTYANGGFGIYVLSSTGTSYYYMGGGDNYEGGWINLCVDPSRTVDDGVQPNLASVTRVGCFQRNVASGKNQQSTWMDYIQCSDGLNATDTAPYTIDDIFLQDVTPSIGGWGIIRKIAGVYFFTGSLIADYLSDSNETIIFEDRKVSTSLYGIQASGDVTLGIKAGGAGVSGLTVKTESIIQTPKFYLNTNLTAVDVYGLYGCTVTDFNTFIPPVNATNREYLNSNFTDFNSIVFGDAYFNSCNFINYEAALSLGTSNISSSSFINGGGLLTYQGGYLLDCNFVAPAVAVGLLWNQNTDTNARIDGSLFSSSGTGHAIELGANTPISITFQDVNFTGYGSTGTTNAAVYNNSGKAITIYLSGTSSAPTYRNGAGATTTIISAKTFTFTVSPIITSYEWRIYSVTALGSLSGAIELAGEETATLSGQTYAYNYTVDTPIAVQIISHPGVHDYIESITYYTLGNNNQSVTIILQEDFNN